MGNPREKLDNQSRFRVNWMFLSVLWGSVIRPQLLLFDCRYSGLSLQNAVLKAELEKVSKLYAAALKRLEKYENPGKT